MRARVLAIALLVGCGGDGVEISTNQDNICSEVAEVACHNLYQCCSEGQIEDALGVSDPRSESECRVDVERRCTRQIAALNFGIDQKHLKFDSKVMNECLSAVVAPSGTCATIASKLPWTEACMEDAWLGQVADGDACISSVECASKDSFCGASQKCIARPTDGQPCSTVTSPSCATGLFCSAGTCRPQAGPGAPCTNAPCQKGLFCDTSAATPTCSALRAVGEACIADESCESDLCTPGTCGGNTQPCFTQDDCFTGHCDNDPTHSCLVDSTCGNGTCSVTTTMQCSPLIACPSLETCVFPNKCVFECVGDVVCGEKHIVVDYCQGALTLPIGLVQPAPRSGG
ncbi:MAG TPA: hypothetical protein VFK02_17255 [Kofleriaceae bacterium]|nr:hypothetical protein [Kofleriaceae bacterium]